MCYSQPRIGFRSGIEPVVLASAVPAGPGDRVLDGGTGAGPALLCLAARVSQLRGVGIEQDVGLAELARANLAANKLSKTFEIVTGDLAQSADLGMFAHACANPPWHSLKGTASLIPGKRSAKHASPRSLEAWTLSLAQRVCRGGTLTMILPAGLAPAGSRALESAGCGSLVLLPLCPRHGQVPRFVLLQATKSAAGKCRILPDLIVHCNEGGYSQVLQAVLCHGAAMTM